jgi:hypothetical protein
MKSKLTPKVQACKTACTKEKQKLAEIKDKFIEIAIKGKDEPDELKGLYLYSRFLDYLKKEIGGGK